jgi:hypothetical protein
MRETPDFARDLRDALMEIETGAPSDDALDLWSMSSVSCPLWTRQSENTLISDCGRYAIAEADDSHLCTVTFGDSVLAQVDFLDKAEAVARRHKARLALSLPV